eukprot:COSAG01_NODE_230_length_21075_cov_13.811603_1_plen_227_part_00
MQRPAAAGSRQPAAAGIVCVQRARQPQPAGQPASRAWQQGTQRCAMSPTWTLLTWALLPSGAFSGPYSFEQDGVLLAGQANFEDLVVYSGQLTLVLFYSPSCPYCVKLEPEFKSAARNLGREQVRAVAVDAVQERGLADYCECASPHHSPQTWSALTRRLGFWGLVSRCGTGHHHAQTTSLDTRRSSYSCRPRRRPATQGRKASRSTWEASAAKARWSRRPASRSS